MLSIETWITILHLLLFLVITIAIESGAILLLEIARKEHLVIVLRSLLATTNETEK